MKTKLLLQTPAAILLLFAALAAPAQSAPGSLPAVNPVTGLPAGNGAQAIDPNTGLPAVQPPPKKWIDPNWKDPDKILPKVDYDNWPICVVVTNLREQFGNDLDIVIPGGYNAISSTSSEGTINPQTGLPIGQHTVLPLNFDPAYENVMLQLRNVRASEVFRAMNMQFEAENEPVRWELTMNGTRPTAVLHVIPALLPRNETPAPPAPKPPETHCMVWFVGDLIGDEKSGGMTMEQIVQAISDVWKKAYGGAGVVQFYAPAQLVIVRGTQDQIIFINQTLAALKQKVELERQELSKLTGTRRKSEASASSGAATRK